MQTSSARVASLTDSQAISNGQEMGEVTQRPAPSGAVNQRCGREERARREVALAEADASGRRRRIEVVPSWGFSSSPWIIVVL